MVTSTVGLSKQTSSEIAVELLRAENRVLELVAKGAPLSDVLNELALSAESLVGENVLCSILLLDDSGKHLLHGAAPSLPHAYNEKIHGIGIGDGVGSCGTAAATAKEVVVSDVQTHPYWAAFKELAGYHGLRACWSTPIVSSAGAVLGTFAMYYRDPAEPSQAAREVVGLLSRTTALVLEKERAERELHNQIREHEKTQRILQQAQQTARIATWKWDFGTQKISFTPGSAEIFGVPVASIVTHDDWARNVHPEDLPGVVKTCMAAVEKGRDYQVEYRVPVGDGFRWVFTSGHPVWDPKTGQATAVIGTSIDITERKEAEEALRQSEKLAATGRLAATIAHEINNPLESVTNFIYLARKHKELPSKVQRHLQIADQELARVTHIAQQTLGFYRDTTVPVEVNFSDVARDVLALYERKLAYKSIIVQPEIDTDARAVALHGEMRQILSNLIANAIDATEEGGRILIRVRKGKSYETGTSGVRLTVADTGSGVDESVKSRIFTPFITTKKQVGTGLGLWITRSMIEKHGGTIRFRSRQSAPRGTVFQIFLPETSAFTKKRLQ